MIRYREVAMFKDERMKDLVGIWHKSDMSADEMRVGIEAAPDNMGDIKIISQSGDMVIVPVDNIMFVRVEIAEVEQ